MTEGKGWVKNHLGKKYTKNRDKEIGGWRQRGERTDLSYG
jgi:hypothetical protein